MLVELDAPIQLQRLKLDGLSLDLYVALTLLGWTAR